MAARNDQGILSRPVALDLTAGTRLRWRWRILALPTAEAEDTVGTHDYTSIGVEFDAGRDLTYSWSAALPVGAAFRCPIRHWAERETHLVVRAGREGLGTWTDEERSVLADGAAVMGPPPARIVAVWLIAVSTFGHGTAIAEVSDIALVDGPDGSRSWAEPELSRASRPAPARGAAPPGAPRTPAGRRGR